METKLNPILINKAIDIYATTPNVQHKDVADELGINYKTLLKLRKDDDLPSYKALLESLENGAINRSSTKISSTKAYYTPHTSLRQMN